MSNERGDIPDHVRVRCLRGFRGPVDGRFTNVNPGDVVTVTKELAVELRTANKAVMTQDPLKVQKDYLPERKRERIEQAEREREERLGRGAKKKDAEKAA